MRKLKLIVLQGLPASGKTTEAMEWVLDKPATRVRINRDDIRNMLGKYWVPSREDLVTYIETKSVEEALWKNYDVVVDATNLRIKEESDARRRFCGSMDSSKIDVELKFLDVPLDVCIRRDKERDPKEQVGEDVIMRMYNKYLKTKGK